MEHARTEDDGIRSDVRKRDDQHLMSTLVRLEKQNDREAAWRDLVCILRPYVLAIVGNASGRPHPLLDLEDIVQDVFLDIVRSWKSLALNTPQHLRSLLSRLAHQNLMNRIRYLHSRKRDIRRTAPEFLEHLEEMHDPRSELDEKEFLEALQEFIDRFAKDELDREIVERLHAGKTQQVVAEELGIHAGTLSRRLKRLGPLAEWWFRERSVW